MINKLLVILFFMMLIANLFVTAPKIVMMLGMLLLAGIIAYRIRDDE